MRENTSPARPGADRRGKFKLLFIWHFHFTCQPRVHLNFMLVCAFASAIFPQRPYDRTHAYNKLIHPSTPVVFRLYGKNSHRLGEISPWLRWNLTIPVVFDSSYKHEIRNTKHSMGRWNLAYQPRAWQVRCFLSYKQALNPKVFLWYSLPPV